ncbi:hypothetical protein SAMN02982931_00744 [Bauldia litoralis]|uniref:Uncharacterized protein n=1 Tax=Bauldia litoralis TaxID=665467 RepID=A0A1G6AK11_9HYPH|nr:hypothetical protein SAMN02982931_00744 [Bauldia litoralis]
MLRTTYFINNFNNQLSQEITGKHVIDCIKRTLPRNIFLTP